MSAKESKSEESLSARSNRPGSTFLKIGVARRFVQFICFILFNLGILGLTPLPIVLPILQSLGSPQKIVGEAFGTLQWMLYNLVFPWLPLASIFLFAILSGRALCGWVCPFGFIQDLLGYVRKEQIRVSYRTHKKMVMMKYFILGLILFICGALALSSLEGTGQGYKEYLGVFAESPFNALSPSDTLFALIPRVALNIRYQLPFSLEVYGESLIDFLLVSPLFWVRIFIMAAVLVLAVYIPRGWCRYFCPQGAFSALISQFSVLGLRREPVKCTKVRCLICMDACPMMIRILDLPWEKFTDPECIYCLRCVEACPEGAIKPRFP